MHLKMFLMSVTLVCVYSCNDNVLRDPIPVPGLPPTTTKVIGWYPYYATDGFPIDKIPFQNLTHINYAFLNVNPDGTVDPSNIGVATTVKQLIATAHGNGTEVFIGVGGADSDTSFEEVSNYTFLALNIIDFATQNYFDGIDIDWETPLNTSAADNYLAFMSTLYPLANSAGLKVSASIAADDYGGPWILNEVFPFTDWWCIMAYDFTGFWPDSDINDPSSYQDAVGAVAYWLGRGMKPENIVLGVPFYGANFTSQQYFGYSDVVKEFDVAPNVNNIGLSWWPSPDVTAEKVQMATAKGLGGIMIWDITQDYRGSCEKRPSLLDTIGANVPRGGDGVVTTGDTNEGYPVTFSFGIVNSLLLFALLFQ